MKIGFKALQNSLEHKGYDKEAAGSIAYSVEVKKYGKKSMRRKAKVGMLKAKKGEK